MKGGSVTASGGGTGAGTGVVFAFSGQGSYSYRALRDLYTCYPNTWPYFDQANEVSQRFLRHEFLPLVTAASRDEHDERLNACPDLDQVGIYLTSVLIAGILMRSRPAPDLLVGHSFGELAALATAGVYSIETGLRIVCQRVAMLQDFAEPGRMAALSCDYECAKTNIAQLGTSALDISVINHPRQTVVSGPSADLERLGEQLAGQGISLTLLKSRYPYHSSRLERAVRPFAACLRSYDFKPAAIPVYLGMEGRLYSPECDLPHILSSQLTRPLDFSRVVTTLHGSGYRQFVECGGASVVAKLVTQNLPAADVTATSTADAATGLNEAFRSSIGATAAAAAGGPFDQTSAPLRAKLETLPEVLDSVSRLVQHTSRLLESASDLLPHAAAAAPGSSDQIATERGASDQSLRAASAASAESPEIADAPEKAFPREVCSEMPVAVVSTGCVLPGAGTPEQYWQNILNGTSGIVNLADREPSAAQDFLVGDGKGQVTVVSDKTYTLLHGSISDVPYDPALLSATYDEQQFTKLTKGQKLLAVATAQSLSRLESSINSHRAGRVQCILGSTADGSKEYDEALFVESVEAVLATLDEPEPLRRAFAGVVEEIAGYKNGDARNLTQHTIYTDVIERLLGHSIRTFVVDAACSSSLYSIGLGMKALQDGECDVVLAGGVFAPGPANNALFAQFRGLTPRESRPFDEAADGVVFGDGAGVVILKRLPDAMADGDRIHAVIRGVGMSSDGKSPSINVPRADGQSLAIRRAYEHAGVGVDTIQYVEAHATATPVGDAVEFSALKDALARNSALPPIQLGSVKALVGHTGWAAGVASVIKLCKALEAGVIPRQYNYNAPNSEMDLAHSPFAIASSSSPWPENIDGYPRRAGINGFGFGGTNAHLILEAFDSVYHTHLCRHSKFEQARDASMALVGVATLFPDANKAAADGPTACSLFTRGAFRLPARKMLLPDVTEHMDASQYLAGLAAETTFSTMPDQWTRLRPVTGVVVGLESKTERGVRAVERIFLDRLTRWVHENNGRGTLRQADGDRIAKKLVAQIRKRNLPSGPYTLPGLMPNVAAGRVASLYDLNGPNIVVDMGGHSLLQSVWVARQLLCHGDCELALAGGISADGRSDHGQEAALLLALTTAETARREGWPVLGTMSVRELDASETSAQPMGAASPRIDCRGGSTAEIARAIHQAHKSGASCRVTEGAADSAASRCLVLEPTPSAVPTLSPEPAVQPSAPGTYAYVQGTPITCYTPCPVNAKAAEARTSLKGRHILFLTDQPGYWSALESSGALAGLEYRVACPAGVRLANALPVDLSTEESLRSSLSSIPGAAFDTVIAVKSLESHTERTLLLNRAETELAWLDLLFAVCRHAYERIQSQSVSVVTLCLGPYRNGQIDPYTGLVSGFMKSLARELPDTTCRIVNTDDVDFGVALRLVEIELGQPGGADEVCYRGGERRVLRLARVPQLAPNERPYLDSASVVIATGGGRGVTATLAEQLLKDFGCRVIALGRTDPSSAPDKIRQMDDQTLQGYEAEFYKEELRRDKRNKITDLKRQYRDYRAANEVDHVTRQLQALGNYEYHCLDITDEKATERFVESVYRKYGRVDFVMHGAGVQVSKVLTKKSLHDFRRIVATKLAGLSYLYKACETHRNGHPVHFHLLTSAFSYVGNDGQCDYGAANEAMNRLAASMNAAGTGAQWSSIAWLGWAGIGMTRDSEFAALAASRRLRGVTKEEGQELFSTFMKGTPATPVNILLAAGEIDFYKVDVEALARPQPSPVVPVAKPVQNSIVIERAISIQSAGYLSNHLVDGIPTVPGALIIAIVAEAAQQLRPHLKIAAFEQASFQRFIRVYGNRETRIRVHAALVTETDGEAVVQVRLLSDFVHRSGAILQRDILQHEILVRMAAEVQRPPERLGLGGFDGVALPDPYVMDGSPVCLSGPFRTMSNITAGRAGRRADYALGESGALAMAEESRLPAIMLMDSLWRFGAIEMAADGVLPVYVPEKCELMTVYFDFADVDPHRLIGTLTLSGANPHDDGERLRIGPIAASDVDGNVLLVVDGGICRRLGEVRNGFALHGARARA